MEFNCSIQGDFACTLPSDIHGAVSRALSDVNACPDSSLKKSVLLDRFCQSLMAAIAPETMLYLDLEDVRDLLGMGELSLGYGRASLGEGALVKACQLSLQCESMMNRSDSPGASGILVIINAPRSLALKLSEVRDGLREIWRWRSETSRSWYTLVHEESASDVIEVYLFMVRDGTPDASSRTLKNTASASVAAGAIQSTVVDN